MNGNPIDKLVKLGFSEYEAKAYIALLRESPVTGYQLSKTCGVPRSMIYEVLGKLTARGAAMTLRKGNSTQYAPVPADEFLDQLQREHEELTLSIKDDLADLASPADLEYIWNIEGHDNIIAKAIEMLGQARTSVYLALVPVTFPALRLTLEKAIGRGVRVVLYTTSGIDLAGCRVVVAHVSEETLGQARGLGLILVIDGEEVLIGEWLTANQARASWTSSPLLVFIAEHHLRTDLYLPKILSLLGDRALDIIQEEDRELFARALESQIDD
ncbi:MAG: helix-turn-helix domain-containing protein [Chloroflexota bacterium]|nr:helix-turn-helix domain-containing protein [Chloroflexota bacterium]